MADQDKQEARELAARAAKQSQQAAKNAGRAAKAAAPIVAETAGDAAEKINDTAEEAVDVAVQTTRKFSPRILSSISSDTGVGFLALSVAFYAGAVAFKKFGDAYSQSSRVMRSPSPEAAPLRPVA
jgi:hypothetical protein